jgi:hypothetical protein
MDPSDNKSAFIGKHWGKRVTEFRDRLFYLSRRRGITMSEAHLAYLASMPEDYWMTDYPFSRANCRFFIEMILGWFAVMSALENCANREEFLAKYGLPDNTTDLIPKTMSDYPKLLAALGREPKAKQNQKHEHIKIHRPDQD